MKRVFFGATLSPFLLSATIQDHLSKVSEKCREMANLLKTFYVDDFLAGEDLLQSDLRIYEQTNSLMFNAGMILNSGRRISLGHFGGNKKRHGEANNQEPMLPPDNRKVFGVTWGTNDTLYPSMKSMLLVSIKTHATKRTVLSAIAGTFYPLGLICSFVIEGKILLQQLWIEKISWDMPLLIT